MHDPSYYKDQAARARRLAGSVNNNETEALLEQAAQDYEELVQDLETGSVEVRHPELMPQNRP